MVFVNFGALLGVTKCTLCEFTAGDFCIGDLGSMYKL